MQRNRHEDQPRVVASLNIVPGRALLASLLVALATALTATELRAGEPLPTGLRTMVQSGVPADETIRAVAMLDAIATQADAQALRDLGLVAQPMSHLPMVLTKGPMRAIRAAVERGIARDMYLDRPLEWYSARSTEAINADQTRALGFDGSDVGIAIVDSGIDASHTDLEQRVVRNVRVYSPEYLDVLGVSEPTGITWPAEPALVIPFDDLPYNNTDTIGHGTHVAGIAAADGSGNPDLIGVAPDANLIGYATGEVLFIFTAVASFNDILATHEEFNIKVVNNSWGGSYRVFDPDAPIAVASRMLHEAGITVVFSAGNSSTEMAINPHSVAPWAIASGSATVSGEKSGFSSGGLRFDNSRPESLDENGHVHFEGDGLGIMHPDVSAPGSNIESAGTPTGVTTTTGTPPNGSATLSGTSMSAPHKAGLAAVLLEANPDLTPDMIRQVMQVTAGPMRDGSEFWQSGFGFVDALAAVNLVRRADFTPELLDRLEAETDARVLAARPYSVLASDHWLFAETLATVEGLESRTFELEVGPDTDAIRAGVAFAGDLGILGLNLLFEWRLDLRDPSGEIVASSELVSGPGVGLLHADFAELGIEKMPGTWTIDAVGVLHAAQPALLWGHTISVVANQLQRQTAGDIGGPSFEPQGQLGLRLAGGGGSLSSPEGCSYDPQGASGEMVRGESGDDCAAGTVGFLVNHQLENPATFLSSTMDTEITVGGEGIIRLYLADPAYPAWSQAITPSLDYQIDAVGEVGEVLTPVAAGSFAQGVIAGESATLGEYPITLPPTTLPPRSRLRLQVWISGVYTSSMRTLWGGEFGDAGLDLTTGVLRDASGRDVPAPARELPTSGDASRRGGGAPGALLLMVLTAAAGWRQRPRA